MNKQQKGKLSYLRIAPRKVRLVAASITGLPVWQAQAQLNARTQRSAPALLKLLNSTVANAKNNTDINVDKLVVKEVLVNGGPSLKRYLPRARGNATPMLKRMSHITLILEEKDSAKPARYQVKPAEKKVKKEKQSVKEAKAADTESKLEESPSKTKKVAKKDDSKVKGQQSGGVMKKMFRRKSV